MIISDLGNMSSYRISSPVRADFVDELKYRISTEVGRDSKEIDINIIIGQVYSKYINLDLNDQYSPSFRFNDDNQIIGICLEFFKYGDKTPVCAIRFDF